MKSIESQIVDIFNDNQDISYLYISIGSKYNEPTVRFDNNDIISTNAFYQQIPGFIRKNDTQSRILSIMIDTFNGDDVNNADRIIKRTTKSYPNLKAYIINTFCSNTTISNIIPIILGQLNTLNIDPARVMICNYIKFKSNPCPLELISQTTIPCRIQSLLNTTTYVNCLYEWFGYNHKMYHFIYNYNKSKSIPMFHHYIRRIYQIIDCYNYTGDIEYIQERINIRPNILKHILSCIYDIISQNHNNSNIACSLYDVIQYNNECNKII